MSSTNSKNVKGAITLSNEQYRDLITLVALGNSIAGILGDVMKDKKYKEDSNRLDDLESYLLESAHRFESADLVDPHNGKVGLDDEYYIDSIFSLVEEYDDYVFWSELESRLGKRDFYRTLTEEEKKLIEKNNGWYPERIHKLYEKYRQEFKKNGIDRLKIEEKDQAMKKADGDLDELED